MVIILKNLLCPVQPQTKISNVQSVRLFNPVDSYRHRPFRLDPLLVHHRHRRRVVQRLVPGLVELINPVGCRKKNNMKKYTLIILIAFLASCSNNTQNDVQIYGALSEIMHGGARNGVVALPDVMAKDHIYGLGSMENLDGEILIMDGNLLINRAKSGESPTHQTVATSETKALLLVSTSVPSWNKISVHSKTNYNSIDAIIKKEAEKAGVNIDKPFPFIIEGQLNQLAWHIISPQDKDGSHDDHLAKSWKRVNSDIDGKILGFYSEKHQAIFTHHTRFTHLHIWFESEMLSGHIDDLTITDPWTISFPKI